MVTLNDQEASEFRERLRSTPTAQAAEETIAVSANASSSVTFTAAETVAVLSVLNIWMDERGRNGMGSGPRELRDALDREGGDERV